MASVDINLTVHRGGPVAGIPRAETGADVLLYGDLFVRKIASGYHSHSHSLCGAGGVFVLHKSPLRKYAPRPLSRTSNNWKRRTKNARSIGPFLLSNERTNERTDESKKTQTGRKPAIIGYFVLVDSLRWFLSGCPFTLCRTIIRLVYYCVINCN